jgi:hypothetical protein
MSAKRQALSDDQAVAEVRRVAQVAAESLDDIDGLDESEYAELAFLGVIVALIQKAIFLQTLAAVWRPCDNRYLNDVRAAFERLVSDMWDDWTEPPKDDRG